MTHETLTRQEQDAMVQATYFDTSFWGNPQDGWGPEALVAMMRGVQFCCDEYGYYLPGNVGAAQKALRDVSTFLGFTDTDIYLNTLTRERQGIFQPIIDAQQRWRCLIRREADAAKQQCPELTERIDDAVTMSLTGAVEIVDDHSAHVISTSHEMGTIYQVIDNRCGCSDAQDHAPDGLCQHRLAVDLTRRVQAFLTQPT